VVHLDAPNDLTFSGRTIHVEELIDKVEYISWYCLFLGRTLVIYFFIMSAWWNNLFVGTSSFLGNSHVWISLSGNLGLF